MITNLRQLDLNLLLVFDALMQEGNLTRAAERLHLSQSTVSNALARLRQQLGEELFLRTARGMTPTARAQALYVPVRQALRLLRSHKRLEVVPGASHLFEEPGTLQEVARLAAQWFEQHLHEPSQPGAGR